MKTRLYVIHGSHPCATVEKALELKGIEYSRWEWLPLMHIVFQPLLFGGRTVPGIKIDGQKVLGSRAILRKLDELRPDPPLLPADPAARERVLEAERWGDEVFQPLGRHLLWPALKRMPSAGPSYNESAKVRLPAPVVRAMVPLIARGEIVLNGAREEQVRAGLAALPGYMDEIDRLIAEGVIGGEELNAADLQITSTLRLLMTVEDLAPFFAGRPAADLARRVFPQQDGRLPAGAYPAEWLSAAPPPAQIPA